MLRGKGCSQLGGHAAFVGGEGEKVRFPPFGPPPRGSAPQVGIHRVARLCVILNAFAGILGTGRGTGTVLVRFARAHHRVRAAERMDDPTGMVVGAASAQSDPQAEAQSPPGWTPGHSHSKPA